MSVAKALMPTDFLDLPLFLATVREGQAAIEQLHALGWVPFSPEVTSTAVDAQLVADHTTMRLVATGQDLFTPGPNTVAPDGWWAAVDRLEQRVVAVVLPHGVNLEDTDELVVTMNGLWGNPSAAAALIPLVDSSQVPPARHPVHPGS